MTASGAKLVHVKVYASSVFSAKVQQVWEVVRDYAHAEVWLGTAHGQKTFTRLLPGQINCQIGAVRLVTIGLASFVDQLDALDDDRHVMKYKLITHPLSTNPFPGAFLNYRTVIRLYEITRSSGTFIEWTGEFDTEPQDCDIMKQAILDRMEAGYQGLDALFPPRGRSLLHANTVPFNQEHLHPGTNLGDQSRGIGSMGLRPTGSMPAPGYGMPPNRSPRTGPGSVASEVAMPVHRGINESGSGSSLASSPHGHDATGTRPNSGGQAFHQWTSGGSGSIMSALPTRLSGEEQEHLPSRRSSRGRAFREGVPEGSTYPDTSTIPPAFQVQVSQRHAGLAAETFTKYHQDQQAKQLAGLRQRESSLGSVISEGCPIELPTRQSPPQQLPEDPLLREREEFRAALLAQRFQHLMEKNALNAASQLAHAEEMRSTTSEPDWSRVAHPHFEDLPSANSEVGDPFTSVFAPGVGSVDDDAEWARMMQQREDDLREAHLRRSRSPHRNPVYSHASGPFGAASAGQHPQQQKYPQHQALRGGPFAAASAKAGQGSEVRRTLSQHSISSLGQEPSGALDQSAGSTYSHPADEQRLPPKGRPGTDANMWSSS